MVTPKSLIECTYCLIRVSDGVLYIIVIVIPTLWDRASKDTIVQKVATVLLVSRKHSCSIKTERDVNNSLTTVFEETVNYKT